MTNSESESTPLILSPVYDAIFWKMKIWVVIIVMPAALPIKAAIPKFAIAERNASSIPETSDGTTNGNVILKKTLIEEAPEILAASSSEGSIFSIADKRLIKINV